MLITLMGNIGMLGSVVTDEERIDLCLTSKIWVDVLLNSLMNNIYADSVIYQSLNYGSRVNQFEIDENSFITTALNLDSSVNQCN